MSITIRHFEPGATWTFVHTNGSRTEYVYDRQLQPAVPDPNGKGLGLTSTHALLNPQTGKHAMVTEKWMREGNVGGRSHWLPGVEAMEEAA